MRIGKSGENKASQYLTERGITLEERNYRSPYGEIDIIGKKGDQLIFFEVKTRTSKKFGEPEESVNNRKKEALINTALHYLQQHDLLDIQWRIDVISILKNNEKILIDWFENAVTSE